MIREIADCVLLAQKFDKYPKCGIFYAAGGMGITRPFCQRAADPATRKILAGFAGLRIEHRGKWEEAIRKDYPKIAATHSDDHKALPRGR